MELDKKGYQEQALERLREAQTLYPSRTEAFEAIRTVSER